MNTGHPRKRQHMVFIDKWSLFGGYFSIRAWIAIKLNIELTDNKNLLQEHLICNFGNLP